jgi:DNA-binding transcriptional LysR family regulator
VVVSRDDPAAEDESLAADELGDVVRNPSSAKDAIELVAAGVGRVLLPHSIARLHARKDVVAIPVIGEPPTEIALVWPADRTTQDTEEFVGIVRGRTAASSRTTPTPPTKKPRRESVARPVRKPQRRTGGKRRQGR